MKVTFISNFMNHHQLAFCLELKKIIGDDFKFVATEEIPKDRINLGYKDMNKEYDFIIRAYEDSESAKKYINNSDVVIAGSCPDIYIKQRIKNKKIVFRYSERVFKNGFKIKTFLSLLLKRTIKEKKNVFLLCASAYSCKDYNLAGAFQNKSYKWGYFPEVKEYKDINRIINKKENNSILWVARFIDWKHPEIPVEIAKRLKKDNYNFTINMIGIGEMYEQIKKLIIDNNLEKNVRLLGSMPPEKVRENMEKSKVFLFTSDKGEGWGAVLNESMNSACAVIASHEIGSVPFLIKDNNNGLIYEDGNIDDLYNKVKLLLDNNELSDKLGLEAYNTMITLWNSKIAAERFIELSTALLKNEVFNKYEEGPCSVASPLKDNWYMED